MSVLSNLTSNLSIPTNTTVVVTISDIVIATEVLKVIHRYMEIFLYIIGVCSSFLNIFTFLQRQLRSNSCSNYFLAASFCDLCTCNILILVNIVSAFNPQDYLQFSNTSSWCKFYNYCMFMFPCLSSLYITFASIDRFCTSSRRARLRKFSSIKVSRITTPCIFLIWGLFSLQVVIGYDLWKITPTATTTVCQPSPNGYTFYVIVDGFFFVLFNGGIVPFFLALFGILIIYNIRQTRHRIAVVPILRSGPGSNPANISGSPVLSISRANLHLITMLLVQVCPTMFLNLLYTIMYLNNIYHPVIQTPLYLTAIYLATWFWHLNYCKTFYVNTLSSQLFRSILKQQMLRILHRSWTYNWWLQESMSEHHHQT